MGVANGDIVRLSARVSLNGEDAINVWHFKCGFDAPMTDAEFLSEIGDAFAGMYNEIEGNQAAATDPEEIRCEVVQWIGTPPEETVTHVIGVAQWGAAYTPAAAGEQLPKGVALLVHFRTEGVRTLLRKYLPFYVEGTYDGAGFVSGAVSSAAAMAAEALAGLSLGAGKTLTLGTWGKRAGAWVNAISYLASSIEAYQRRRRPGVGS